MANKKAINQQLLFLEILKALSSRHWKTQSQLRQVLSLRGYEIPERKLQRMLKDLRENEEFAVECDTRSRPFAYRRAVESDFESVNLSAGECLLLKLLEKHLKYLLPGSLLGAIEPLFSRAEEKLQNTNRYRLSAAWFEKTAVLPGGLSFLPPSINPIIFRTVSEALFKSLKLQIRYNSPYKGFSKRIISPLGLVQQGVRIYLVAAAEENGEIRHFALHRFEDASMINTPANKPVGFELEAYLQNTAFNYTFEPNGGRLIELEFELSNSETVKNLRETPLSRQQTVSELEDGFWRIRAIVRDSCLLDGWLEAWRAIAGIRCITKRLICLESSGSLSETGAQTAKNLCSQ